MRKWLVATVSCALALLVCEGLLSVFGGEIYDPPLFPGDVVPVHDDVADPWIGWKLSPAAAIEEATGEYRVTYHSNRQGFRSKRDFSPRSTHKLIAFLGDSYTFGSGVEDDETFADLIERKLDKTWCYNLGIGGFGVDQMWMTLRRYALPLHPDLVVVSFIRNDLDRSLSAYRLGNAWHEKPTFRLADGELVRMSVENRPPALWRLVYQKSRLYRLWRRLENSLSLRHAIGYRWRLNRAIFQAIRDDCRKAHVPLVVVYIPANRLSEAPLFKQEFADLGIDYLDLQPLLPADSSGFYYPRDRHLTAAGHRFTAEAISSFLSARGLLGRAAHHPALSPALFSARPPSRFFAAETR